MFFQRRALNATSPAHSLVATDIAARGVHVAEVGRGGDVTYHGPGQIVGYPIVSLDAHRDLHAYLRFLEDVLIAAVGRSRRARRMVCRACRTASVVTAQVLTITASRACCPIILMKARGLSRW